MTVTFNDIPSGIRTPGHFVEVDATGAIEGTGERPHAALIIGYRFNGGTATDGSGVEYPTGSIAEGVIQRIAEPSQADGFWGTGSQMHHLAIAFQNVNERTPLYGVAVNSTGTKASGTITIATAANTGSGVLPIYVGGRRYQITVPTDASAIALAANAETEINNDTLAIVTANASTGTLTLTAKHGGPEGNDIDIRVGYRETDALPSGITVSVVAMSGGATSPDLDPIITGLGGQQFDTIVTGITDAGSIAALEQELDDRWDPMVNLDGHLFYGFSGDQNETTSYTGGFNSFQTTIPCPGLTPTPPWIAAANVAAHDAEQTGIDPARPRTTLVCPDVLAPVKSDRWDQSSQDAVLNTGGATVIADAAGNMIIQRLTTTYQTNQQGAPDPTWLDLTTKRTVSYLRWNWDTRITLKYPRHKLANDGTPIEPGQAVVTPGTIRAEAVAWFTEMQARGLVEGLDQFREDLVVERNTTDFNRIDAILRPNVINKFVVSATKLQFRL